MTQTNRSFIKAFRHDTAKPQAGGTGGSPVAGVGQHGPARATVTAVTVAATTTTARAVVAEKRPLSTYISRNERIDTPHEPSRSDVLKPGTTIASFQWPPICRTLLQQCGPQFDETVRLLLGRAGAGRSVIGVLGMFPRVGATTTALCLASRAAASGRRVVLVDGNFRSPRVAAWLDAVPTAGWEEVLKHTAPLGDALIHATLDKLDVLTLGARPVKDPLPLVAGLQVAVTAGVLRHAYDLVLIDLGTFFDPVSQPTVLEVIGNMGVDAALAIAGPAPADPRDLATVCEYLRPLRCELLGTIESRVAKPQAMRRATS